MRRLRLFSHDDVDCARVSARGKAARTFYKFVLLAYTNSDQAAIDAVRAHPLWSKHCKRLAAMRQSGELDRMNMERAYAGGFFRCERIADYHKWRDEQRFIFEGGDEPMPAWLRAPVSAPSPSRVLDRV